MVTRPLQQQARDTTDPAQERRDEESRAQQMQRNPRDPYDGCVHTHVRSVKAALRSRVPETYLD
jgi:hypothetical protein